MKFLGIDFGWSSGASGLCCLGWQAGKLELLDLRRQFAIADVLAWVDHWAGTSATAVIAVDAPTLIPNQTGMRLCDRLAHKHFGRYHAGCYPANLGRPFAARTIGLGLSLEARGFIHAPDSEPRSPGRFQLEVFPHPAMIHLFDLPQIIKYKKGKLAERRLELARFRQYLCDRLPQHEPPLAVLNSSIGLPEIPTTTGAALKAVEDQLDSLICAYVAAHWWYWGLERNWVLGDRQQGYIVVPAPHSPLPADSS